MKIIFLGTNGWYSTDLGNTSCILLDSEKHYVLFDAGDGVYKLNNHVKTEKPISLFLSHLHLDHIIGLHIFSKFNFRQGIRIYGYYGTQFGLNIIRHPYTAPFKDLSLKVAICDLSEGTHLLPFPVTCKLLVHADPSLGYRFELDDRVITYCTDTGLCDNLYKLAENADLLITECSFKSKQEDWGWPHLKPEDAANVAKQTNVKLLVLTHFDANIYRTLKDRDEAEAVAKKIFEKTVVAYDGLEIEL